MKKRFTDASKWSHHWFRELNPKYKLLWLYCCDVCSAAGIVHFSPRFFTQSLNFRVNQALLNTAFGDKLVWLDENTFFLPGFVEFQYGTLSAHCKPHQLIIEELKKWGLVELENGKGIVRVSEGLGKGIAKGMDTLTDKEKESEERKEKDIKEKKEEQEKDNFSLSLSFPPKTPTPTAFDLFWQAYPKYRIGNKDKARRAFEAAQKRTGISAEQIVSKAKEYAASEEANKDGGMFAKGAAPWLNDDRFLRAYAPAKQTNATLRDARTQGMEVIRGIFGGGKND